MLSSLTYLCREVMRNGEYRRAIVYKYGEYKHVHVHMYVRMYVCVYVYIRMYVHVCVMADMPAWEIRKCAFLHWTWCCAAVVCVSLLSAKSWESESVNSENFNDSDKHKNPV